ncbi:uncharacterized protein AAGF69_004919 [Amazona ochrocephala]
MVSFVRVTLPIRKNKTEADCPYFHGEGADSPERATVYCTNICIKYCHYLQKMDLQTSASGSHVDPSPNPLPSAWCLRLNTQGNAMSEFIHLPVSGCLGHTVLSPDRTRLEKILLHSGSSALKGMKKPALEEESSSVRRCWSLCAPPGVHSPAPFGAAQLHKCHLHRDRIIKEKPCSPAPSSFSETRQDDQGPFLCGVVVPEQPSTQEHHRGLPAPTILRGPPARFRVTAASGTSWCSCNGRSRTNGPGTPPHSGSPDKARLCSCCPEEKEAGGHPRGTQAWLTLFSPFRGSPAAGGRPCGAEQSPPEESPERSCSEEAGGKGGRRLRTTFSAEQVSTLESSFQRQQYLGAAERRKLSGRMRLSEVQIKTWFQNRRMKLKRQLQELRTESFCSPRPPYWSQSSIVPLSLTYMAQPPPLLRQGAVPGGFTLAALPAPSLDLSSACRAQPVGFWAAPCFVGYGDPTAFLLGV